MPFPVCNNGLELVISLEKLSDSKVSRPDSPELTSNTNEALVRLLRLCHSNPTLRYLGIPVPSPYELLHDFEGLSKLAKILS
jgi:hypothetical protein